MILFDVMAISTVSKLSAESLTLQVKLDNDSPHSPFSQPCTIWICIHNNPVIMLCEHVIIVTFAFFFPFSCLSRCWSETWSWIVLISVWRINKMLFEQKSGKKIILVQFIYTLVKVGTLLPPQISTNPDVHEHGSMRWLRSRGIWMTHWWPRLVRGMPRVQKIEPVWIGAGQELSGESTNCSKLTFVPPGGTQTGIDRQSDPTTHPTSHPSSYLPPTQLSSSLHQSHLIVFPLEMLYIDNSLYIIPPPPLSFSRSAILRAGPVSGCLGGRWGNCWCACGSFFSSNSAGVHLMGSGSC